MKIAFYAPLKSPRHPVPSGDRQMALALIKALEIADHEVEIVSDLRSFSKTPHDSSNIKAAAQEANKIIARWSDSPPDLWFSYHPYYKAPDFIALEVLKTYPLPLVTAECSIAPRRDVDEWVESQQQVRSLLQKSRANFYFTDRDIDGLLSEVAKEKLVHLAPFIDVAVAAVQTSDRKKIDRPVQLVTMGMMRGGVKLDSYAMLAQSLAKIPDDDWQLTVIGDGKKRHDVEAMFGRFGPDKLIWHGEVLPTEVQPILAQGDIFVWPGHGEAYGLAYMEAQAVGLPVIAQNTHGVPFVVADGLSGVLVDVNDTDAFATAVSTLINDPDQRKQYGNNAHKMMHEKHNLMSACRCLSSTIERVVR